MRKWKCHVLIWCFLLYCFGLWRWMWNDFRRKRACHGPLFSPWEISNMISNYSSISVFSFEEWTHALPNWQRQCIPVLILFKLGRIPANESLEWKTVFFLYFCKLLCTKTYSWKEKWHCFLYLKLFKKWVETPINLGCVVTWAYFLLWGRLDSS